MVTKIPDFSIDLHKVMVVKKSSQPWGFELFTRKRHVDTQIKLYGKIVKYSNFWKCGSTHGLLRSNISTGKIKTGNNLYYRGWTWCEPRLLDCCGASKTSLYLLSNCKWQRCLFISDESSKVILQNSILHVEHLPQRLK